MTERDDGSQVDLSVLVAGVRLNAGVLNNLAGAADKMGVCYDSPAVAVALWLLLAKNAHSTPELAIAVLRFSCYMLRGYER